MQIQGVNQGVNSHYVSKQKFSGSKNNSSHSGVQVLTNEDKSCNGKFDFTEAGKNFVKGVISPVTAAIKHPVATIGLLAGTVVACATVPVLGPIMLVGFGALSLGQLGKGCYNAIKNYKNGEYDKAEKSFNKIGEGFVGTLLTAIGVKQSARVAKEAKIMSELKVSNLDSAAKTSIAEEVENNGFIKNIKEITLLFTTKSGLKSVATQFKPFLMKERFVSFVNMFKFVKIKEGARRETEKIRSDKIKEFKNTPEGQRRAAMTDEEIAKEVQNLYDRAFDELGIPKENRPNIDIIKGNETKGGAYNKGSHQITINTETYRNGTFELEDVVMHEATHCKEALLRSGIPQDRVDAIVKDELLLRIKNGESEEIIFDVFFGNAAMMKSPKLPAGMKVEFSQLAKDMLYTKDNAFRKNLSVYINQLELKKMNSSQFDALKLAEKEKELAPLLDKLSIMVDKYPEFISQYGSKEEALFALKKYSQAQTFRYNMFTNVKIAKEGRISQGYVEVNLTPEELARAEKSLVDNITTIEGNGRMSGINGMFASNKSFNQYQFSPEEVLAQRNGNQFLIDSLIAKIQQMRQAGTLSAEDEAYMTKLINKAKAVIEYKTKGLEYYEKYTQLLNNPTDKNLEQIVKNLEKELSILKENIDPKQYEKVNNVVKTYLLNAHPTVRIPKSAVYQIISALKESEEKF